MLISDIVRCQLLFGNPISLNGICELHPSNMRGIVGLGDKFHLYLGIICTNIAERQFEDKELQKFIEGLSNIRYLLLKATSGVEAFETVRAAFRFFLHEEVTFLTEEGEEAVVIGNPAEKRLLTEAEFLELGSLIKEAFCLPRGTEFLATDTPDVRRYKMQMAADDAKRVANKQGEDEKTSLSNLISCLAAKGNGLNIQTVGDMSYYAFHDQLKRMGMIEEYETLMRAKLAGAKIQQSRIIHWMKPPKP